MKIKLGVREDSTPFELDVKDHLINSGLAIIGKRGTGKSYTVGLICEKLSEIGQPFIIIDVMGQYYTLKQQYQVIVASLGNEDYADIKNLTASMAENLARAILETGQSVVIDVSYASMLEQYKFLAQFFKSFYENAKVTSRPIVLVIDEVHRLTPEKSMLKLREVSKYQNEVTYWVAEIARTGRKHGIGYIVAGQREAETAKTSLTQCEIQINFKVTGIDFDNLRRKIPSEMVDRVKHLSVGEAVVLGFDEEFIVKIDRRKTPHGGETPEFKPVKVDVSEFTKLLVEREAEAEEIEKVDRKTHLRVKQLEEELDRVKRERDTLKESLDKLKREMELVEERISEETISLRAENEDLKDRISELEKKLKEYEEEIDRASELERELDNVRESAKSVFDSIVEFSEAIGMELVPFDITELKRRNEELEQKLRVYEMTEKERKIRVREVLEDRRVKNMIEESKRFLSRLLMKRGTFPDVMRQALRFDPEVTFYPEDINADVTVDTIRQYLKELASKGLLIETSGKRVGFKNAFMLWVNQKLRRIIPTAPDEAVDEVVSQLFDVVFG